MLTLPIDLVLHIFDVGNLTISDAFALYQSNRLLRQKLSHPYFWNVLYNKLIAPIYEDLEIHTTNASPSLHSLSSSKSSSKSPSKSPSNSPSKSTSISSLLSNADYFSLCHLHYRRLLELKQIKWTNLAKYNSSKVNTMSQQLLAEFGLVPEKTQKRYLMDHSYLPALLNLHAQEEKKLLAFVTDGNDSTFDITLCGLLQYLIVNQYYHIGLQRLEKVTKRTSYESMAFTLSLLDRSAFRKISCRRKFIRAKRKLLHRKVSTMLLHEFDDKKRTSLSEMRYAFYARSFQLLLKNFIRLKICQVTSFNSTLIEAYDLLNLYAGYGCADQRLLLAVILEIIQLEWESFTDEFGLKTKINEERSTKEENKMQEPQESQEPQEPQELYPLREVQPTIVAGFAVVDDCVMSFGNGEPLVFNAKQHSEFVTNLRSCKKSILNWLVYENKKSNLSNYLVKNRGKLPNPHLASKMYLEKNAISRIQAIYDMASFPYEQWNTILEQFLRFDYHFHGIVLSELMGQQEKQFVPSGEKGPFFGQLVETRYFPGIITGITSDKYYKVKDVCGDSLCLSSKSCTPWKPYKGRAKEHISMIYLLKLEELFGLGFRKLLLDRELAQMRFLE